MGRYLLQRLAAIVPTLVLVSMLIFGLQQLLPGDPAKILAGEEQDPQVVAHVRLPRAGQLDEVARAQLLVGEQFDDAGPQRVGQHADRLISRG